MAIDAAPDAFDARVPRAVQMAAATFAILALELALIRWTGSQIRVAAYFANLVLLASFLGLGLGVGLGERRPDLFRWTIPALAVLAIVLASSRFNGLYNVHFPDPAISLWGAETANSGVHFLFASLLMTLCFWCIAGVFVLAGVAVGSLFARMPPLAAYGADIAGSLAGVIAMAVAASFGASPPVWFALGVLPLLFLRRDLASLLAAVVVLGAAAYSIQGAVFSPYNRIDVQAFDGGDLGKVTAPEWTLDVNRDFHQYMLDLRLVEPANWERLFARRVYDLPFRVPSGAGRDALIVGAGAGNDVAAALRNGFGSVTSIDIDRRIIELGRQLHPEQPYSDPRVTPVVNDARAYFEQNPDPRFAVVCYGLLDSHAMFSALSSLRLDNYVYTVEGLASGWRHVRDDGVMSVSFSLFSGGTWMRDRMIGALREATGIEPIYVDHGYNYGATFLVGRRLTLADVQAVFPRAIAAPPPAGAVRVPTDDWPFLYLRPGAVPWAYLTVFGLVGITGTAAVGGVFGGVFRRRRFDPQMFLLGAGFMLLETRMVTQLSLLFGSTWIVNTSVFGGILLMILLANALSMRRPVPPTLGYVALAAAILLVWAIPVASLNAIPLVGRLIAAGVLFALPVFFAGTIFSGALRDRGNVPAALGSNLCGALLGGMLEYLSMLLGMRAVALLALVIYLASMLAARPAVPNRALAGAPTGPGA